MRSWLAALRIARREMGRARARSALVVAMIAVPVGALGFAAASYDMFTLTPAEQATRQLGAADALVEPILEDEPILQDAKGRLWRPEAPDAHTNRAGAATAADVLAELPDGSRAVPLFATDALFRTANGGLAPGNAIEMNLADPIYRGMATISGGRAPATPGEVAMSKAAREHFGDTIRSRDGSRSWTAVGTVELSADLGEVLVFAPGALPRSADEPAVGRATRWLADTPAPVNWNQVRELNQHGFSVTSRAVLLDPPAVSTTVLAPDDDRPAALSLVPVVVGLAMLEIVLLAGPAFAVGARRRQRSLALIAANGGTRAHLRRIVLADGLALGLTGAVLGLSAAVVLAVVVRPYAENLAGLRAGGYRFDPPMLVGIAALAMVTGLLAATVPAFTAARANVTAALTGQRGVVQSKRRWLILGLAMTAIGAAVAVAGSWKAQSALIAVGLAVGHLGLALATPSLIGLIARFGGGLPVALRIALRDAARNRAAAAPAISAVMAAVAGTVTIGVYLSSQTLRDERRYWPELPSGYVSVRWPADRAATAPPGVRDALAAAFPGTGLTAVSGVGCPVGKNVVECSLVVVEAPSRSCPGLAQGGLTRTQIERLAADPRCTNGMLGRNAASAYPSAVGDRDTLAALTGATGKELRQATAVLDRGGVVVTNPALIDHGVVRLQAYSPSATGKTDSGEPEVHQQDLTAPGYLLGHGEYPGNTVISPAVVKRTGFQVIPAGIVAATTETPGTSTIDLLNASIADLTPIPASVERGPGDDHDVELWILAAASAIITLGAASMATGLAAADGRADLFTLAAAGATPGLRRRLSLSQAGLIAGLGSALGIGAGIGSAFAVLAATNVARLTNFPLNAPYPLVVPARNILLTVMVPVIAMLSAGLLTRSRLPIERRRAT